MKTFVSKAIRSSVCGYGLFWTWNFIFLGFILLGFAPLVLPSMVLGAASNIIPLSFVLNAVLLIVIPLLSVLIGIYLQIKDRAKLFGFGYAVEGPLMLLVAFRLFVIRELTVMLAFVLIAAALGMLTFLWQVLDKKIDARGLLLTHLRVIGLTLFAIVAMYTGVWLAFYAIPFAGMLVRGLFEFILNLGDLVAGLSRALADFPRNLAWIPFMVFGMLAFAFSATLFVLMPVAVPILILRAWWGAIRNYIGRFGTGRAALLTTATAAACAALFIVLNQQPQTAAFALLETTPTTAAQAQELAAQEQTIRQGLLNAYLAPQRYLSTAGEVQHIRDIYQSAFGFTRDDYIGIEQAYQVIAAPLLYKSVSQAVVDARWNNGAMYEDSRKASELYENYFDESIFDGERETVLAALGSTWDAAGAQQAIQDADDRQVHLNKQEINVVEHGDWADFELHEEYQNESGQRQEVVYYITLPESAVITGVWLGNSENREERSVYRVSPRGAAQQVYRQEVRRNIDPALVEQIGPRQYRVRVFPVEPKSLGYERSDFGFQTSFVRQGPPLHLWLTWRVMNSGDTWTLPYLAEKRNVYWDSNTVRTLNKTPLAVNAEAWLPTSIAASTPNAAATHRFDLPDGQTVIAQPVAASSLPALPNNARLAVVLDRSRSMLPLANDVNSALAQFKTVAERGSAVDVYLTASKYRGESATRVPIAELNASAISFLGGQNPAELLQQFAQLRGADAYDAIFLLTDGTGYALGANDAKPAAVSAPLWFVHLGGKFPLGYDDPTLQEIQSTGGGVTGNLDDALNRFAASAALKRGETVPAFGTTALSANAIADWSDGYVWFTLPTSEVATQFAEIDSDEQFAPFAARRLILTNVQRERALLEQLNTLDQLHALAKQYSVVTPYSSMIVLINEFQQRTLDELEKQGDRFDREVEEVGQTSPFDVTAVPEPHEYLLMALGLILFVWYARKRRRQAMA